MSLTTILKEMETARPNAEMDVQLGSPNTYRGRLGLKNAATETLKRLTDQYRDELMKSTVFIVVTGAAKDEFANLASADTFGCFSTDPEHFYKDLATRVDPAKKLYGRESVQGLFNIAGNVLYDKAMELGLDSYNMLSFSDKYNSAVNNVDDFTQLIKRAINDQVGPEIVGINAVHLVTQEAIKKNHSAPVTPVILNTSDEKLALELHKNLKLLKPKKFGVGGNAISADKLPPNSFLVVAGKASKALTDAKDAIKVKKVDETSVSEALATIRNKIL